MQAILTEAEYLEYIELKKLQKRFLGVEDYKRGIESLLSNWVKNNGGRFEHEQLIKTIVNYNKQSVLN